MLAQHCSGDSYRTIAEQVPLSHETIRKTVIECGKQLIADFERVLILAEAARYQGRDPVWPAAVIPPQLQVDRIDAINTVTWLIRRLRERGWQLEIETCTPPAGGIVLMIRTVEETN